MDDDWLVARRRSTDSSSIGSHELWLYHRLGGAGTPLTSKDRFHGAVEPSASPDGRYIYFSRRSGRFAYNSDPGSGIWQVVRLDRKHSQMRPLTGEFGGAIRVGGGLCRLVVVCVSAWPQLASKTNRFLGFSRLQAGTCQERAR